MKHILTENSQILARFPRVDLEGGESHRAGELSDFGKIPQIWRGMKHIVTENSQIWARFPRVDLEGGETHRDGEQSDFGKIPDSRSGGR